MRQDHAFQRGKSRLDRRPISHDLALEIPLFVPGRLRVLWNGLLTPIRHRGALNFVARSDSPAEVKIRFATSSRAG